MPALIILFMILLTVFLFGLAIWWINRVTNREAVERRRAMTDFARRWGARYDSFRLPRRFAACPALNFGRNRRVKNVISGVCKSLDFIACDYECQYDNGTVGQMSVLVVADRVRWHGLMILPKGTCPQGPLAAGTRQIEFESSDFNRRFYVTGQDRRLAYDVVTPEMMEFLLAHDERLCLELSGSYLTAYEGHEWTPDQFEAALAMAEGFLDRVPEFVYKDRGLDAEKQGEGP
jgi:hypothetical protein